MDQQTPPVTPSTATPVADTAAGSAGAALPYARADHAHPISAGEMVFQNAADNNKKFQRVQVGSVTVSSVDGAGFVQASGSTSWPATFATTPVAQATATPGGSDDTWVSRVRVISTTAVTCTCASFVSGSACIPEVWGLG